MLKKEWKIAAVLAVAVTAAYFITRLANLNGLPIFTDEAIYIRWSQIGARDPNWRFISLTDGKQPMFTWIMMVLMRLVPADPLVIGRLTSVLAGLLTMTGIWAVTHELFARRTTAWVSTILYIVLPFSLWYDRMALYDSWVAAFSVWSLYLGILLVRLLRLDVALILGLVLGAGMLNKSSAFLHLYFLPVTLLLFDWSAPRKVRRLLHWFALLSVSAVLSQLVYSVLRLSPFFHMVGLKDNVFIFSLGEWFNQPFRFSAGNLRGMFDWLRHYLTTPLFVLILIPVFMRWKFSRERWLLYVWWILPFAALANFAKILYPRFILFMTMPLIIIAADAFIRIWDGWKLPFVRAAFAVLIFLPLVSISYTIVADPANAAIPPSDRGQFVDDWPAGGGVAEVVAYLRETAKRSDISVFTEGTFGLMPYALEIYLVDHPNITIQGIWPLTEEVPESMWLAYRDRPTYFILNETQVLPANWPMTLIGQYQKGRRTDRNLRFYRMNDTAGPL